MGDKRRQDLRKADAPSNTGTHVEKKRDKGKQGGAREDKTSGRQTHHPTKENKKGDKASETRTHHPR